MIRSGDWVLTRDDGMQQVLWAGGQQFSAGALKRNHALQPITIDANAFGPGCPARPLSVSPQHRLLCTGAAVETHFGTEEVLASAKGLSNGSGIGRNWNGRAVSYHHILFSNHQIIRAEGLWAESLFAGDMALSAMTAEARQQIDLALGSKRRSLSTARMCLTTAEASLLAPYYSLPQNKPASQDTIAA